MTASSGFLDLVKEMLEPIGSVAARRMFGGAALYIEGQVFAFVDNDCLYFKTDEEGRAAFEAEGAGPFTYTTKFGPGTLWSYWRVPERLLDEPDEMILWARRALAVARRSQERPRRERLSGGKTPRSLGKTRK